METMKQVKDHPIIFSGEMVRAILEGRKTQTRRTNRLDKINENPNQWHFMRVGPQDHFVFASEFDERLVKCPYGVPGDRLWVRETFCLESNFNIDNNTSYPPPFEDGRPVNYCDGGFDYGDYWEQCHYRATDEAPDLCYDDKDEPHCRWKPSIHMPRWASRITLEITDVFVQRLNDIMPLDVHKEGIPDNAYFSEDPAAPMDWFKNLWNSINEKRGCGWDKNPWVWVVQFKVVGNPNPESPGDE